MIDMQDAAYGYGAEPILSDMTLRLAPGSFHFLTGPSGSGKTTFLKLCYGELLATQGSVTVFGQDTATLNRDAIARSRQRIGVVHQDCAFLDHLPIAENIALPLTVSGRDGGASDANMRELIAWVGLSARAAAHPMPPRIENEVGNVTV